MPSSWLWCVRKGSLAHRGLCCCRGCSFQRLLLCHILADDTWFDAGLTFSKELISRDAGLHAEVACLMYDMLGNKLPEDVLRGIIRGAVDVERRFICEALSCWY